MDIFNTSVGMLGLLVSVVGLWLTYSQAKQAKDAAEAAKEAAEKTLAQSRKDFMMYVARNIGNILTELKTLFNSNDFGLVSTRLGDLHKEIVVMSAYSEEFSASLKTCATLANKAEAALNDELKEKLKKSFATFHRRVFILVSKQTLPAPIEHDDNATEVLDND